MRSINILSSLLVAAAVFQMGTNYANAKNMKIEKSFFDNTDSGEKIEAYTLDNGEGVTVKLITWGATIVQVTAPDRNGKIGNVVLGADK